MVTKRLKREENQAVSQVEDFREKIRWVLLSIIIVSIFLTGLLDVWISPRFGRIISFWNIIGAFFTTKVTFFLFPALCIGISVIAIQSIHKTWEESLREDKLHRGFLHSKDATPYGDARFEEPHEYVDAAQIRPIEKCKGKILGQLDQQGKQCVDFNPYEGRINSHMIAIGRSGGGKTFTFVKNFMLQSLKEKHSLFIADPKGDLYREMSGYFRDNGYVVRKLDLKTLEKSDGWHCLGSLHGTNLITNTQIFSSTVMANISEHDDVYSRAGGSLLSALILRVLQGEEYPPEKKTIQTVHELLQNPGGIEFLDALLAGENVMASEMACTRFYMDFKRSSGNLSGNIITHLATGIQLFNNSLLSEILSTDDINLELAGQVPCIYFINFPDTNDTYRFVISLFFSMAFIALVDYADIHTPNGKLPVPVDFLLDEFPALGVIPDWDRKIATVRSRAINCVMIVQDIPQLKMRYFDSWMTILNNCGCLLTLGINEPKETAKWLSERIGEASIEVISESETKVAGRTRSFTSKKSVGVGKRQFLSPAELCELSRDGSIVIFTDHKPVYVNKIPYTLFPDADKLYDTLPDDVCDFTDKPGRKLLRAAEEEYRKRFWKTHAEYPDMRYKDLSDALLVEPPADPVTMTLEMLRDDFLLVVSKIREHIARLKKLDSDEDLEDQDIQQDRIERDGSEEITELSMETAPARAFERFLEEYKMLHRYDRLKQGGAVRIDENTGEVIDDVHVEEDCNDDSKSAPPKQADGSERILNISKNPFIVVEEAGKSKQNEEKSTASSSKKTAAKAAKNVNTTEMKESPNTGRKLGNGGILPVSKTQKL